MLSTRFCGTSPVVQWLRIHAPLQGAWVQSLVDELRSRMLCGQKKKDSVYVCFEGVRS